MLTYFPLNWHNKFSFIMLTSIPFNYSEFQYSSLIETVICILLWTEPSRNWVWKRSQLFVHQAGLQTWLYRNVPQHFWSTRNEIISSQLTMLKYVIFYRPKNIFFRDFVVHQMLYGLQAKKVLGNTALLYWVFDILVNG